ncbi:MAG TPA: hypothetical protein VIH59_33845 [Candidatus Tectomicrobia bacterium]|jgi:hypothetical protein
MHNAARYPFLPIDTALGEAGLQPRVPLTLTYQDQSVAVTGLLDTGAMGNVLPYPVGADLGAVWEQQTTALRLTGNLAQFDARALLVSATIGAFAPVRLVFAWPQAPTVRILCVFSAAGQAEHGAPLAPCSGFIAVGWCV